jgi:hypothetical protein
MYKHEDNFRKDSWYTQKVTYELSKAHYDLVDGKDFVAFKPKIEAAPEKIFFRKGDDMKCNIYSHDTLNWRKYEPGK